jgi:CRP/FNR family transcriptional regulator, cyclic AMP receptor protein
VNARSLKSIAVFAGLDRAELQRVADCAEELDVQPGDQLLREGSFAFEFFAIRRGAAEVVCDGAHVANLGPGDVFGELAALSHGQRNASVVATAPTTVVFIRAQDFRHFAEEMPELGSQIRQLVEERRARLP